MAWKWDPEGLGTVSDKCSAHLILNCHYWSGMAQPVQWADTWAVLSVALNWSLVSGVLGPACPWLLAGSQVSQPPNLLLAFLRNDILIVCDGIVLPF